MAATITSKGQLTVPIDVRRRLRLRSGDKVDFVVRDDGRVEMVPVRGSVRDLKGCLPKPAKPVSLRAMERAIQRSAGR